MLFLFTCSICVILFNTYMRNNEFKIISWNNPTAETVTLNRYIYFWGRGGLNNWSYDAYVLNGWPQADVAEYFFCTDVAKYTKASPPARKMSLLSSYNHCWRIHCHCHCRCLLQKSKIFLSYTIIRIYISLHFAGLWNWGTGRTALSYRTECITEN